MKRKGIIIGGGASGLMAAITAARHGAEVIVLEHMPRAGKKLLSTGNGKCNLTNLKLDAACYRCGQPEFPMAVVERFMPEDSIRFFRRLGVVTTQRGGYVYPNSGQARTVLDALLGGAEELGVVLYTETEVKSVAKSGEQFTVDTSRGKFTGDFVILAAGSCAARSTGSDGSGYELARSLGHSVAKPLPALVQLRCRGKFFPGVSGVRTEGGVTLYSGPRLLAEDRGELQLTDYGISGIPVFQVSRFAAQALDRGEPVRAVLDFYPQAEAGEFFALLREQRKLLSARRCGAFMTGIFNKKLADLLLKLADIRADSPVSEITKPQLSRLCRLVKEFEVEVTGVNSFDQAQICMGGVRTREVNPNTMESKKVKGLYLTGEILDVDGICGGYNLQWAWASGHLAGCAAAEPEGGGRR